MTADVVPIQRFHYHSHIIEATAVQISGAWYPLLQILSEQFIQTHPWQVPAVTGVQDPSLAVKKAISIGHDLIHRDLVNNIKSRKTNQNGQ